MFPPMVTSPLTSKFPVISTSSTNCILSAASNIIFPLELERVLPLNIKFPVSTFSPVIIVFELPVVNVNPLLVLMLKLALVNVTVPSSWLT